MSSARFTVDTNILRIRDVFAMNPLNAEFIQPLSIPVIGRLGQLQWYSSLEFLSSISVPSVSSSLLDILTTIQPGISTLSTVYSSTIATFLASTVTGLGSANYVSTSYLDNVITLLSQDKRYISATTLYDCFNYLANMRYIGDNLGPMSLIGSNFSNGYVSTINPGNYTLLQSSIGLLGSNVTGIPMNNSSNITTGQIPITGFLPKIVSTSKLLVEVQANLEYVFGGGALTEPCYISSYITAVGNNQQIGDAVTATAGVGRTSATMANLKFYLRRDQIPVFPGTLQLHHTVNTATNIAGIAMNSLIPTTGGVFVSLNNID